MGGRGSGSSGQANKWETAYNGEKSYQRKKIREFRDNEGRIFKIYELANRHNELTIKEQGEGTRTIRGRRSKILDEIKKYWKGSGTFR